MIAARESGGGAAFHTTRWTLVVRSRGETSEARAALAELCEAYWRPVFEFVRRDGREAEDARELTQEFFARMLARGGLDGADPGRGRFRSYLLGAVKHFLGDMRDRECALKRGGGAASVPLASGEESEPGSTDVADACGMPEDTVFDRVWAVSLVNRAVEALALEYAGAERRKVFEELKPWLLGESADGSQRETAARLEWTENAVRVGVHRMRRRFRELVRSEISQTVEGEDRVREEMRYLLEVLSAA